MAIKLVDATQHDHFAHGRTTDVESNADQSIQASMRNSYVYLFLSATPDVAQLAVRSSLEQILVENKAPRSVSLRGMGLRNVLRACSCSSER